MKPTRSTTASALVTQPVKRRTRIWGLFALALCGSLALLGSGSGIATANYDPPMADTTGDSDPPPGASLCEQLFSNILEAQDQYRQAVEEYNREPGPESKNNMDEALENLGNAAADMLANCEDFRPPPPVASDPNDPRPGEAPFISNPAGHVITPSQAEVDAGENPYDYAYVNTVVLPGQAGWQTLRVDWGDGSSTDYLVPPGQTSTFIDHGYHNSVSPFGSYNGPLGGGNVFVPVVTVLETGRSSVAVVEWC